MLKKLSFFIVFSFVFATIANAQQQQTPAPKAPAEKKAQRMILEAPFAASYLGVQAKDISKENMAQFGLREVRGVAVEKVSENSPAAQAGIQAGDVVLKFNGEEVSSVRQLTRLIGEVAPDHQARITVLRGGSEREVSVTMGKREMPGFETTGMLDQLYGLPGIPEYPNRPFPPFNTLPPTDNDRDLFVFRGDSSRQIGVGVTPLTKQLGEYFGVSGGKGLLINSVRENSPAAKAGLRAGDVIVEVEGKQVGETFDLLRIINEKKEGDVTLTVVRDRNRQTFRVTPEVLKGTSSPLIELENLGDGDSN